MMNSSSNSIVNNNKIEKIVQFKIKDEHSSFHFSHKLKQQIFNSKYLAYKNLNNQETIQKIEQLINQLNDLIELNNSKLYHSLFYYLLLSVFITCGLSIESEVNDLLLQFNQIIENENHLDFFVNNDLEWKIFSNINLIESSSFTLVLYMTIILEEHHSQVNLKKHVSFSDSVGLLSSSATSLHMNSNSSQQSLSGIYYTNNNKELTTSEEV
ncbi:hypothetical protein ABK040_000060 [Willaertia magna]